MARVRSLKEAGYDPEKYYRAETESRRRFTDKLAEGVEGISSGLSKAISGTVQEKKADASQLAQLNELYNLSTTALSEVDKDMSQTSGKGLFESKGVENAFQAIEQDVGPKPGPDASREEMQRYMQKLNTGVSAVLGSLIQKGKLSSGAYTNLAGKLKQLGIDPTTGQKAAAEKEFAADIAKKTLAPEAVGPRIQGAGALRQAFEQGIDISKPGRAQEAVGMAQASAFTPEMTSQEMAFAAGGEPVGQAKAIIGEAITPAQRAGFDLQQKAIDQRQKEAELMAGKKVTDEKKSAAQQAAEKELTKIRQDIDQNTTLMKDYEGKLLKAEPEYNRLKDAVDSVKKGEAVPGEFVDPKGNPYNDESLRRDFHKAEAEYKTFKKNYDASYKKIEELSQLDTSVSGRIQRAIDVENKQKQMRLEDATRLKDTLDRIISATPADERAENLTVEGVANMMRQIGSLSEDEINVFIKSVKDSGRPIEDVYQRLLKHIEKISQ